jgi:hypothetical protein
MKKTLLFICVAALGCDKPKPTCVTCFVNGIVVFEACIEDYPASDNIYQVREAIDPLILNEECYYND